VMMRDHGCDIPMLVDWGTNDQFIDLLRPETLTQAAAARRSEAVLRLQKGYDHSYFFVSTFMRDHIEFHADALYSE